MVDVTLERRQTMKKYVERRDVLRANRIEKREIFFQKREKYS
jgi:hypothetical protein